MIGNIYEITDADGSTFKGVLTGVMDENEVVLTTFNKGQVKISLNKLLENKLLIDNEKVLVASADTRVIELELKENNKVTTIHIDNPYYVDLGKYPEIIKIINELIINLNRVAINNNIDKRFVFKIGKTDIKVDGGKNIGYSGHTQYVGYIMLTSHSGDYSFMLYKKFYEFESFSEYTGSSYWANLLGKSLLYEGVALFAVTQESIKKQEYADYLKSLEKPEEALSDEEIEEILKEN
jgi:hypothetical protein